MEFKRYFYTNYYVSKCGNVKSIFNNKERLLIQKEKQGYLCIKINGKRIKVHRMVLICWDFRIDYIFMLVNHKDGNKKNNNIQNLEWCTQLENINHYHKYLKK